MQRSLGMALALGLLTVGFALGFPPAVVQPGALFVTNASNGAGDLAIQARLGALGYQVTSVLDSTTGGQDAAGKAIVVISASASAFNVGVKFKGVTTPVLVCQSGSFNNMGMTGSVSGTDYGTSANQTSLTISNPAHPMAAGLNGLQTVVSSAQTFSWGAPAGAAVIVATNAGHSAIFCFDTGAQMASGLTAAARRTGFFLEVTTAGAWNAAGQALFDAAVRWTANCPAAPASVYLAPAGAQVALTWAASTGATSYNVKNATTSGGPYTTVGSPTTATFTNTGLTNGTKYYYVVSAVNAGGEGGNSAEVAIAPPGVPTGLAAVPGDRQVAVSWTAVVGATQYNVKRATASAGPYTTITSPTSTSYTDASVTNGTIYYYEVSALFPAASGTFESGNSAVVTATPVGVPPIPTGFSATSGNAQAVLSWTASAGATSYNLKRGTTSGGPYSTIVSPTGTSYTNTGLTNGAVYFYVVTAVNASGESAASAQVTAAPVAPPSAPTGVVGSPGNGAMGITWVAVPGATLYHVKRSTTSGGPYTIIASPTTTSFTDTGVANGISYYYVVSAVDAGGEGPNSAEVKTIPATGVGALLVVGNTTLGAGDAAIQTALQGLGYSVTVKQDSATVTADAAGKAVVVISSTVTSANVSNKFAAVVQPVLVWSGGVMSAMGMTGLGSGTDYGTTASQTAIAVVSSWHPMAAGLTGTPTVTTAADTYTWGVPNAAATQIATLASDSSKSTIFCYGIGAGMPGLLAPGRRAGFFLGNTTASILNAGGTSLLSAAVRWCTTAPPPAPTGLTRTASTGQVSLSWTAVGGATGYVVKRSTTSGGPYAYLATGLTAASYVDTSVANGTAYYYVVTAVNTGGEGAISAEVTGTPVASPAGLIASAGAAQASLNWVPVTGATGYNVKRSTTSGSGYATVGSPATSSFVSTGLTNGTTYYFVVTATNTGGESANSSQVPVVPSAGLPAPTGVTATAGNGQVALAWSAVTGAATYNVKRLSTTGATYTLVANVTATDNTDTGLTNGSPVFYVISAVNGSEGQNSATVAATPFGPPTGLTATAGNANIALSWAPTPGALSYNVKSSTSASGPFSRVATVVQSNYTNLGLTNGTTYYFVVTSVSGAVESASSAVVTATPIVAPAAPTGLSAVAASASVTLSWAAVPGATLYTVKRSTTSGSGYLAITPTLGSPTAPGLTATTYLNFPVSNGVTYYYVVSASNAGGESPNSAQSSATPMAAPAGLAVTPGNAQIQLTWSAVPGATSYNVKRSTSPSGPYTIVASPAVTTATDTGLANGTSYYYVVTGVNSSGESQSSGVAVGIPLAPPAAPTALVATPGSGKAALSWVWTGPGAVVFRVKKSAVSGGPYSLLATPTNAGYLASGLANGTAVYFVVTAVNGSGESPNSNEVAVTPTLPAAPSVPLMARPNSISPTTIMWIFSDINNADHYDLHDDSHNLIATIPGGSTSYSETDLTENSYVSRHIHAVGEGGSSAASNSYPYSSRVHDPTAADFSLHADSGTQVTITVTPPPNAGTYNTGRTIQGSIDQYNWWTVSDAHLSQYVLPDPGLQTGMTYYFRISFRDAVGNDTLFSLPKAITTLTTTPPTPTLTGTAHTTTSIVWSWASVAGETSYELHDAKTNALIQSVGAGVLAWEETGLAENTQYSRYLVSVNPSGPSPASATVARYTLIHTPAAAEVTLSAPSTTQITVGFGTLPNSGSGNTWAQIQEWSSGSYWGTISYGSVPYTASGLAPGTSYLFRVSFRNGDGIWTPFSPVKSLATPSGAPNTPTLALLSAGQTWIQWQLGGTVLGETLFELHDTAHNLKGTSPPNDFKITETGLTENTSYDRHVHSDQGTFQSPASPTVTGWTLVHDPLTTDIVSVTFPAPNQVTMTVASPPSALLGASGCDLQFSTDAGLYWSTILYLTHQYSATATLTEWGGKVWFRFRYKNGLGVPTAYSPVVTYTLPSGVPVAPGGLSGNPASTSSIQWSWWNVKGNTGFVVHDPSEGVRATTTQDTLTGLETGLSENTSYTRHVHAMNASGLSLPSAPFTQWTMVHTPTLSDFTLTQISPTQIDISVVPPPNSTAGTTGVLLQRSTDHSSWSTIQGSYPNYLIHDKGVVSGTQYFYRIAFTNADAWGTSTSPWKSLQATPAPTAVPATPYAFNGTDLSTTSILWSWVDVGTASSYEVHDPSEVVKASSTQGIDSALETGLTENQAAVRHLFAVNSLGKSVSTGVVTRYTLVHVPTVADFSLSTLSGSQVKITVNAPPNTGSGSSGVWVDRLNDGENVSYQWWVNTSPVIITDGGLQSGCTYSYRIHYQNGDGVATPYTPIQSVTLPAAPPPAPTGFAGTADSTSSILWIWANVWGEDGYVLHDQTEALKGTVGVDILSYHETGLSENTAYTRHVIATNALNGPSPSSASVTHYTLVHAPTTSDIQLSAVSSTQINLTLVMPPNGNVGYSACSIDVSTDNVNWVNLKPPSNAYTFSHVGLTPGTTYYYRCTFWNGDFVATPLSPPVTLSTAAGVPTTPGSFAGVADSPTGILWSWTDAVAETAYVLHDASHNLLYTLGYGVDSFLEPSLSENTAYTRHVHGTNAQGTGPASNSVTRYTKIHQPVLADFTTNLNGTTGHIAITVPPNSTLGLTGCQIDRSQDTINWSTVKFFDQNYAFDDLNLQPGTTFYYRFWFRNGDGVQSVNPSPWKVMAAPPPAPPGAEQITIWWQTSSSIDWQIDTNISGSIGGATGFVLHDSAHNLIATINGVPDHYIETGLAENTVYTRHIHGTNAAGLGAASNSFSANTYVHNPLPTDFTLTALTPTSVSVSIVPPLSPTVGATGAEVQRYDGGVWKSIDGVTNTYSKIDVGLTGGTTYLYRLRYLDQSGYGYTPYSLSKPITTPASAPVSVPNFRVQSQTSNSVTWAWDAVPQATQYQLRDIVQTVKGTTGAGVLSYTETGLPENAETIRLLYFISGDGASAPTAPLSGSTAVHTATTADFSVQPVTSTRVDVVVFSPPGSLDGQTGVEIQHSPDGTTWTDLQPFSSTYGASDLGVTAGQTWYYRIQFRGRLGSATGFSPAKSVVVGAPAAPGSFAGAGTSTSSVTWSWADVPGESGFQVHDPSHLLLGTTGPGVLSYLEGSLAENIQFTRHVHAVNGMGASAASTPASIYSLVHDPLSTEIQLKAVSGTEVDVTVSPPPNPTAGLTGCEIQRSPDGSTWTTIKAFSSGYTVNDTGLTAVTSYSYRFRYRNGDGIPSAYAPTRLTLTVAQPVITTPSKRIRNSTIAVAGTVTSGVGSVHVYFNETDKGAATVNGTAWTFSSPSNPEGVYAVTARAFVGAASSDDSNTATIQVVLTPPAPPTNIRTTAYSNAVNIEWDASISPNIVGYRVYRKTGTTGTWGLLNTTGEVVGTKYQDTPITSGTTYFYHVTSVDDALPN